MCTMPQTERQIDGRTDRQKTTINTTTDTGWLSSVLRPRQHHIGYYGRRFLQVKRPNQQYQSTEGEKLQRKNQKTQTT